MKTKFFKFFFPILIGIIFTSCDVTNKEIKKDNIEKDIAKIKEYIIDSDPDSIKINFLDGLLSISQDLDYYIKVQKEKYSEEYSIEEYLVSNETFKENTTKLFTELKDKKYTYKKLFKEIDEIIIIKEKYYKQLEPIYLQIDSVCTSAQAKIDDNKRQAELMKDSLNKTVELKLLSIRETEIGYLDVVAVRIEMINKTDKPIEALSFELELIDKLGNSVATLNCKTNDRFIKSDVGLWTFGRYDRGDMYDKLKNVNASHVKAKQKIKKINIDGNLFGADMDNLSIGEHCKFYVDFDYKSPKKLYGFCPYLKDDNPYTKNAKVIEGRRDKEIKKGEFPIIKLWDELELYDFK
jgi:hypothetical protein